MTPPAFTVGAFVTGAPAGPRQLVRHADLWAAYADGAQAAAGEVREAYLSHYVFGPEYRTHFRANRQSVAGFAGPCRCRWLVFDLDRDDLALALADARRLVAAVYQRYPETDGAVPVYFSGGKGFHVLVELAHEPPPAAAFPLVARTFAGALAAAAGVVIDPGIYDVNRLIRLPNTRHPRTGLFKRRFDPDALFRLDVAGVLDLARHPAGDGIPSVGRAIPLLAADWREAEQVAARSTAARGAVRGTNAHTPDVRAPRDVLELIRFGVNVGDRHRALFRAAAWLAEQGAPPSLVSALLTEPGCDLGLAPKDVARQIGCGVAHAHRQRGPAADPAPDPAADPDGFEAWAVRHEPDPLPPGALDFPYGAAAPGGGAA